MVFYGLTYALNVRPYISEGGYRVRGPPTWPRGPLAEGEAVLCQVAATHRSLRTEFSTGQLRWFQGPVPWKRCISIQVVFVFDNPGMTLGQQYQKAFAFTAASCVEKNQTLGF